MNLVGVAGSCKVIDISILHCEIARLVTTGCFHCGVLRPTVYGLHLHHSVLAPPVPSTALGYFVGPYVRQV